MSQQGFAIIGCRLLAVYWFMHSLNALSYFVVSVVSLPFLSEMGQQSETLFFVFISIIPFFVYLGAVVILWFGAARISSFIINDKNRSEAEPSLTIETVQVAAFSVIGIFLLCTTIPEIAAAFYKIGLAKQYDSQANIFSDSNGNIFMLLIKMILGFLLLFGARGLSGTVIWFRELGHKK